MQRTPACRSERGGAKVQVMRDNPQALRVSHRIYIVEHGFANAIQKRHILKRNIFGSSNLLHSSKPTKSIEFARRTPSGTSVVYRTSVWNTQVTECESWETLGERIVKAARLAVAVHLFESLTTDDTHRQQVVIGGAGPCASALDDDDLVSIRARARNKATDGERT